MENCRFLRVFTVFGESVCENTSLRMNCAGGFANCA